MTRDEGRDWLGDGEEASVELWDECQNVASPDERYKGPGRNRITLDPVAPAFRFLPDLLANIIRRIGRRTAFIKPRATARIRGVFRLIQSSNS